MPSDSRPGIEHTITVHEDGHFECSCEAFYFNVERPRQSRLCKHLKRWAQAVVDAEQREGWFDEQTRVQGVGEAPAAVLEAGRGEAGTTGREA